MEEITENLGGKLLFPISTFKKLCSHGISPWDLLQTTSVPSFCCKNQTASYIKGATCFCPLKSSRWQWWHVTPWTWWFKLWTFLSPTSSWRSPTTFHKVTFPPYQKGHLTLDHLVETCCFKWLGGKYPTKQPTNQPTNCKRKAIRKDLKKLRIIQVG